LTAVGPPSASGRQDADDPCLVWMAGVSWDGIRGTDRHLATALTRHARILWVDPPVSVMTSAARLGESGRRMRPRLCAVDDRLTRLMPVGLPGLTRPGVRATTGPMLRAQVLRALDRLGIRPFAVVSTHFEYVLGQWGDGVLNVLYGTDDLVAGARLLGLSAGHLLRQERTALARADVVAAVSQQLADRWTGLGSSTVLIPNGCTPAADAEPPPAAVDLPGPVVGLVGQLSERIDLDLLYSVADAGFSLLLVGPLSPQWESRRFAELIARPLVHYAGMVPAEAVPSYLAVIDVGITPYRDTAFNRASFPLKTLEYLGAGRPVVTTDLPAARWLQADLRSGGKGARADEILALAGSPAEFVEAIRAMTKGAGLAGSDPGDREVARSQCCRAFADQHSWSRRADALAAAIGLPDSGADADSPSAAGRGQ
jgi:teichuronic acid biosynthesis glycosyltransferase TuaH